MADLLVLGAGLLGTSVGLALSGVRDVVLSDEQPEVVERAVARGAGRAWDGSEPADLVLACVPPAAVGLALATAAHLGVGATFSHVSSVQTAVAAELEALHPVPGAVCGGHPVAGSERSGPDAARADLFAGRPWAVCPGPSSSPAAVEAVTSLALDCGAEPRRMTPQEHDAALALVSHLPQVVSSALAARLLDATDAAALAGGGLRDTTRIAASDPLLWREVLSLNAGPLVPLLRAVAGDLAGLAETLDGPAGSAAAEDLVRRGRRGRALVPVKREEVGSAFTWVAVSVPDRPGRLAELMEVAAGAGVNVEDVRVEHVPGRPRGLVQLAVRVEAGQALASALASGGHEVVAAD